MILILRNLDDETEQLEVEHVIVTTSYIRYFYDKQDTTLFLRDERMWYNYDTSQAWKEVSICPK